jgi:prepilin-type N-terminal cleavage/methylation domain-containing protein
MNRRAFTLLEVLVATAILSLMVVLLASIAGKVSKVWQDVSANNQQRAAARVLLHFMASELEAARKPVPMPSATNAANLQMVASMAANAANATVIPGDNLYPHALFWQVPAAQNTSKGNIASVGYFIRWDTTSHPGRAKPVLCRFFAGPSDVDNFQVYAQTGTVAQNWLSVIPMVAPATSPDYLGWLSDNVIGLWIRFLDADGQPITKNASGQTMNYAFDSRQGYTSPTTGQIHPAPAYPPCVEIALVTVDCQTLAKIQTLPTYVQTTPADFNKGAGTPGSVRYFVDQLPKEIKAGARIFFSRVYLQSGGM